ESVEFISSYFIRGTGIESIIVPKSLKSCGNEALSGAEKMKTVIFEDGIKSIPDNILDCRNYQSPVEKVVIPGTVTSIGTDAFYKCDKMTIYGLKGSYAEKYANSNNIPFADITAFQDDLYKTADYTVKVIDATTGHTISYAKINISGDEEQEFTADKGGIVHVTLYSTMSKHIVVSKDGYESKTFSSWPWSSDTINTVRLQKKQSGKEEIISMTPQISMSGDKLKGPEIKILGNTFNLFETDVSFNLPIFDNMVIKEDPDNKTYKVLVGFNDKASAKLEAANADDTYWSDSYQQVKSLVKSCGGKVDTPKLWNRFSSIRGQLKDIQGTAAIRVGGKATGFIELSYASGKLEIIDSGLVAMMNAGVTLKAPLFWCVYEEFGLDGEISGQLNFKPSSEKQFMMSGNIGLALTPSMALGVGASAVFDIKGGIEGALAGKLSFPAQSMKESLNVTMSGKLFMKTSSPVSVLCYSKNWDLGTLELYPDFGAYLEASDWKLAVDDRVVPKEGEAYEYANPQMVSLNDGRKVKVYIADDGTKSTGNHTTLMYQVYDNGTWSSAKAVCETGRADSTPVLYAYGNKAYVAWLNINKVISSDTSAEDIYANTDLYFAEFSGTAFGEPELVPDTGNQKLEFNYAETADENGQVIAWVENSKNDPFMQDGANTIYVKTRTGNGWSEKQKLCTTKDTILNLEVLLNDGQVTAYYSDGTWNYSVSGSTVSNVGEGSNTKIFNGRLFYLENGTLHEKTAEETVDYGVACGSNYQIMDDTVYWTVSTGYTSELYMQKLGTSEALQLTYDNAYISSFTLTKDSSGQVMIEYVSTEVDASNTSSPYGKSYMKSITGTEVYDLACEGISYDAVDIQPGTEAEFKVQIANYSSVKVNNIKMRVTGKNNTAILNDVVIDSLEAGKSQEVSFKYTLPSSISGLTLKAEVYADGIEEAKEDNNSDTCTFDSTDLQVVTVDKDEVVIKNNGYITAEDVKVSVYEGGSNGTLVDEQSIGSLASGKSVTQNIYNIDKYLDFETYEDTKVFLIRVTSSTDEALLADNDYLLQIEPPHVTGVSLEKAAMTLAKGKKAQLNVDISAEIDADTSVFWNSSDKDIVTVDDQGNVTAVDVGTAIITVMTLDGGYSADCEVTVTEARETLTTVELISAKAGDKGDIFISWKAVEGAEGYLVYRKSGKESWKRVAELKSADDNSWTDTTGTIGTAYTYTV
ncbi:Ig-like domain-containing protein, partial [Coprococcus catus]